MIDDSFNSRSREGSDVQLLRYDVLAAVSIRAPARGATLPRLAADIFARVSIRAPARGATKSSAPPQSRRGRFNSRSREGSDDVIDEGGFGQAVSIRAPARGATAYYSAVVGYVRVSIRAPARGATVTGMLAVSDTCKFQFALPRGERLPAKSSSARISAFQFALPRGERPCKRVTRYGSPRVSIRAPARGATFGHV